VSTRRQQLTHEEIQAAFPPGTVPPILSPAQLANLFGKSRKTIYEWIEKGRHDGAFRKHGRHILIWRDRVVKILFNSKEWK